MDSSSRKVVPVSVESAAIQIKSITIADTDGGSRHASPTGSPRGSLIVRPSAGGLDAAFKLGSRTSNRGGSRKTRAAPTSPRTAAAARSSSVHKKGRGRKGKKSPRQRSTLASRGIFHSSATQLLTKRQSLDSDSDIVTEVDSRFALSSASRADESAAGRRSLVSHASVPAQATTSGSAQALIGSLRRNTAKATMASVSSPKAQLIRERVKSILSLASPRGSGSARGPSVSPISSPHNMRSSEGSQPEPKRERIDLRISEQHSSSASSLPDAEPRRVPAEAAASAGGALRGKHGRHPRPRLQTRTHSAPAYRVGVGDRGGDGDSSTHNEPAAPPSGATPGVHSSSLSQATPSSQMSRPQHITIQQQLSATVTRPRTGNVVAVDLNNTHNAQHERHSRHGPPVREEDAESSVHLDTHFRFQSSMAAKSSSTIRRQSSFEAAAKALLAARVSGGSGGGRPGLVFRAACDTTEFCAERCCDCVCVARRWWK